MYAENYGNVKRPKSHEQSTEDVSEEKNYSSFRHQYAAIVQNPCTENVKETVSGGIVDADAEC